LAPVVGASEDAHGLAFHEPLHARADDGLAGRDSGNLYPFAVQWRA
jgi:hypothetical protein